MSTIITLHISSPVIRCTATANMPEHDIVAGQDFFLRRIEENRYEVVVEPDTEEIPVVVIAQPIESTPATPVIAVPHKQRSLPRTYTPSMERDPLARVGAVLTASDRSSGSFPFWK
jgi:hypothetical protein